MSNDTRILEKELSKKYVGKRFTIKELEKSLNFHLDLHGAKKIKLVKIERPLPVNDFMLLFTYYADEKTFCDIDVFYLKTNQKGYIYITEFNVESCTY